MEKPEIQTQGYYYFIDCCEYINKKYNIDIDDYEDGNSFCLFILETEFNEGRKLTLSQLLDQCQNREIFYFDIDAVLERKETKEWAREILLIFQEEFGSGYYRVGW